MFITPGIENLADATYILVRVLLVGSVLNPLIQQGIQTHQEQHVDHEKRHHPNHDNHHHLQTQSLINSKPSNPLPSKPYLNDP